MKSYNILLLGSGGRENAIAWKLRQSKKCKELYIAPGNAGTAEYGTNLPMAVTDFESIRSFCLENHIDMVIPGGEDALVAGIFDFFRNDSSLRDIIVAGPSKVGAQLEGSKAFAKEFMKRQGIPTAAYREFDEKNFEEGIQYISQHTLPVVIKADGLAAGKGVVISHNHEEAVESFSRMIKDAQFGDAGKKVVIEEFLEGIELSVFVLTDGRHYVLLPEAKDYKRIGEGDKGPNTGGMGAISPVPFAKEDFMGKVKSQIIHPTIEGLKKEKIDYNGFIFFGLMNVGGDPYVIEYNCRMGDPETEVVMPRLKSDLLEMIEAMSAGQLANFAVEHDQRAAGTVMLVSAGYPDAYEKGKVMTGLDAVENSLLFHAGTIVRNHEVQTNGGRVLAITSYGSGLQEALARSYENAARIQFEGKYFRTDIGWEFPGQ